MLGVADPRGSARSFGGPRGAGVDGRFLSPRSTGSGGSPRLAVRASTGSMPGRNPLGWSAPAHGATSSRSLGSAYDYGPNAPSTSRSASAASAGGATVPVGASSASAASHASYGRPSPDGLPRPSHSGAHHAVAPAYGAVSAATAVYAAALHGERWAEKLFSLARHGRVEKLAQRIDDDGVPVDARDRHGNTLLMVAGQNGLKRVAKAMLRRGADINARNHKGDTVGHFCFAYGFGDLGHYLISKGLDPTIRNHAGATCYEGLSAANHTV